MIIKKIFYVLVLIFSCGSLVAQEPTTIDTIAPIDTIGSIDNIDSTFN